MMPEPREYTEGEVRQQFLQLVWSYIKYWHTLPDKSCRKRLEGLAFGILVILDGESTELPGFIVSPNPHEDDKEFLRGQGENWYPEGICDIAGSLHELFHSAKEVIDTQQKR